MGASLRRVGTDATADRQLLLLEADSATDLSTQLHVGSKYFVAVIACDATTVPANDIASMARRLLDAGCVYFCCWGNECERVHDVIDEEYARGGTHISDDGSHIMTTWHADKPLSEALWFGLNAAFPDDRFFDACRSLVAVCIGNHAWAMEIEHALEDTGRFNEKVLRDSVA
jgi:hypothetical protein